MSTATPTARPATPSSPPTASPRPRRSATGSASRPAARARCSSSTARRAPRPRSTAPRAAARRWRLSRHQGGRRAVERRLASGRRLQAHPGHAAGASRTSTIVFGQADALALGAAQAVKVANPGHKSGSPASTATRRPEGGEGRRASTSPRRSRPRMGRLARRCGDRPGRPARSAGRAAAGRDADHQGQCRAVHRQPSLNVDGGRLIDERSDVATDPSTPRAPRGLVRLAASARASGRSRCCAACELRRAAGRGRGAARRERRRQVHLSRTSSPGLDQPDAGTHGLAGAALCARHRPPTRYRGRHRHDPSGDAAAAGSVGRRECLCRPAADARRPDRPRDDERARRGAAEAARPRRVADTQGARPCASRRSSRSRSPRR